MKLKNWNIVYFFIGLFIVMIIIWNTVLNGSGFFGFDKTTRSTITGPNNLSQTTITHEYIPGKTFWDWLQLLIVPAILAGAGFRLSQIQKDTEQQQRNNQLKLEQQQKDNQLKLEQQQKDNQLKLEQQQKNNQLKRALDHQREQMLQNYLDRISELLEKGLKDGDANNVLGIIARSRTLSILPRIDPERKATILKFLYEANLIEDNGLDNIALEEDESNRKFAQISLRDADFSNIPFSRLHIETIDLSGANLSSADLSDVELTKVDLSGADLSNAILAKASFYKTDLSGANLTGADLTGAKFPKTDLSYADLTGADLTGADLSSCKLINAFLSGANLSGANLRYADLGWADLSGANLSGADLSGTNVKYATLPDANTSKADLSQTVSEITEAMQDIINSRKSEAAYAGLDEDQMRDLV